MTTLQTEIRALVEQRLGDAEPAIRKDDIARSLTLFVRSAIDKYAKGLREHGGDLCARPLGQEARNEIIDLFFYTEAGMWIPHKEME